MWVFRSVAVLSLGISGFALFLGCGDDAVVTLTDAGISGGLGGSTGGNAGAGASSAATDGTAAGGAGAEAGGSANDGGTQGGTAGDAAGGAAGNTAGGAAGDTAGGATGDTAGGAAGAPLVTGGAAGDGGGSSGAGGDEETRDAAVDADTGSNAPVVPLPIAGGVGAPCETDLDCPTNEDGIALLSCLTSASDDAFGLGGPQGGYCSRPCETSQDCRAVDPFAACITLPGGARACIGLCQTGRAANALECGADRAHACFPVDPGNQAVGGCLPMCTSDAACGSGRFCDNSEAGLGLCRSTPPAGAPIGAPCSPETEAEDCAGDICLNFRDDRGVVVGRFCSASCTFLSPVGCGFDEISGDLKEAACINSRFASGGPGDLGYCFEICDADTDCAQSDAGWVCRLFDSPATAEFVGRLGQCVPRELAGDDPPDGG